MLQFSCWWGWQLLTTFLNLRTKDCAILCRRSSVRSRDPSAACSPVQTPSGHLAHSARGTPAMAPWVQLGLRQTWPLSDWCKFSVTLVLLLISVGVHSVCLSYRITCLEGTTGANRSLLCLGITAQTLSSSSLTSMPQLFIPRILLLPYPLVKSELFFF